MRPPYDHLGNICGHAKGLEDYKYLYIDMGTWNMQFLERDPNASKYNFCVKSCPKLDTKPECAKTYQDSSWWGCPNAAVDADLRPGLLPYHKAYYLCLPESKFSPELLDSKISYNSLSETFSSFAYKIALGIFIAIPMTIAIIWLFKCFTWIPIIIIGVLGAFLAYLLAPKIVSFSKSSQTPLEVQDFLQKSIIDSYTWDLRLAAFIIMIILEVFF